MNIYWAHYNGIVIVKGKKIQEQFEATFRKKSDDKAVEFAKKLTKAFLKIRRTNEEKEVKFELLRVEREIYKTDNAGKRQKTYHIIWSLTSQSGKA